MRELDELRRDLDTVDVAIVDALARRQELVTRVLEIKHAHGLDLRDRAREGEVMASVIALGGERRLDAAYLTRIFHPIIDHALDIQREWINRQPAPPRIAPRATWCP